MKKLLLYIFVTMICFAQLHSQPLFTKVSAIRYSDIPSGFRIDNSGIYGVSSFDIQEENVWLNSFDLPESYCIKNGSVIKTIRQAKSDKESALASGNKRLKKLFLGSKENILLDSNGRLYNSDREEVQISVKSRSELDILYEFPGFKKHFVINFPSNLAYGDLIGIDRTGNSFILTETYVLETPLKIHREVYTLSPDGEILSVLEIPSIKYMYLMRDFQIDAEGNLYHLLSEKDRLSVIKWSGLTAAYKNIITYPAEYNYEAHFNDILPVEETSEDPNLISNVISKTQAASRLSALKIAESYVLYQYSCNTANLAPTNTTAKDGDIVRTPSWLISGMNAKVPYKWGGFNSLPEFSSGLRNGRYAGDINTQGVSSYAVGVDCSGFVSRCWQMTYHSSTSGMPDITTQYSSWDSIRPGDAVHKVGHVRLFIDKMPNGALRIAEASGRDWAVSYWTYAPSDLSAYTARCYKSMATDNYSLKQPAIQSVIRQSDGSVKISWISDTVGIKGYRLYSSPDGARWNVIKDEISLKDTFTIITPATSMEFYRVSSVLASPVESNWSGAMGAGSYTSSRKVLIVDGFDRETGGWRGKGNVFTIRYGKAISAISKSFETIKSRMLIRQGIKLTDYDAVFWMSGDESTIDETFSAEEQELIEEYLENGGNLFVSGSEIGWDLYYRGNNTDKSFYNNYLKAAFVSDNASSGLVSGKDSTVFSGSNSKFGQMYEVGYPDEIIPYGGSNICMLYSNNKTAGVQYEGRFGNSDKSGKIIYLAFPLETTANDTSFNDIIAKADKYFSGDISSAKDNQPVPSEYILSQNYPNPFNPETRIAYSLPSAGIVSIKIFDILGNEIERLVDRFQHAGHHTVTFDASGYASGIYLYRIQAGSFIQTKKMTVMK